MIFYKNYNLLIYSKIIITIFKSLRKITINEIIEDSLKYLKSFNLNNDLFNVKEIQFFFSMNQYCFK